MSFSKTFGSNDAECINQGYLFHEQLPFYLQKHVDTYPVIPIHSCNSLYMVDTLKPYHQHIYLYNYRVFMVIYVKYVIAKHFHEYPFYERQ